MKRGGAIIGALLVVAVSVGSGSAQDYYKSLSRVFGPILFSPDATYDIGANGANRPLNVWITGQIQAATFAMLAGNAAKVSWTSGYFLLSGATPTVTGFGTGATIAGGLSAFRITIGTPVGQSGVVTYNNTPANINIPIIECRDETTQTANPPTYTATTSQVTITFTTAVAGDKVGCSVLGLP